MDIQRNIHEIFSLMDIQRNILDISAAMVQNIFLDNNNSSLWKIFGEPPQYINAKVCASI